MGVYIGRTGAVVIRRFCRHLLCPAAGAYKSELLVEQYPVKICFGATTVGVVALLRKEIVDARRQDGSIL